MARHLWSLLCERVLRDIEDDALSLIDLLSSLTVERPRGARPGTIVETPVEVCLVTSWDTPTGQGRLPKLTKGRVRLIEPGGAELSLSEVFEIDLTDGGPVQTIGFFGLLPMTRSGMYRFLVEQRAGKGLPWVAESEVLLPVEIRRARKA